MKKRIFPLLLILLASVFFFMPTSVSAAKETDEPYLDSAEQALYARYETYTISAHNFDQKVRLTYHSSNQNVATVSKKGVITPKKKGNATITVKGQYKGKSRSLKMMIEVKNPSVLIANKISEIDNSDTYTFLGETIGTFNTELIWTVSNENAVIDRNTGLFQPLKPGKVMVTVKNAECDKDAACIVTIYDKTAPVVETAITRANGAATVHVSAKDPSGIKSIVYCEGSSMNSTEKDITSSKEFTVTSNSVYTIKATDCSGLSTIQECEVKINRQDYGTPYTAASGVHYDTAIPVKEEPYQIEDAYNIYRITGSYDINEMFNYNDLIGNHSLIFEDEKHNVIYQTPYMNKKDEPIQFDFIVPESCQVLFVKSHCDTEVTSYYNYTVVGNLTTYYRN